MYEKLVKGLRRAFCTAKNQLSNPYCFVPYYEKAADAIEELSKPRWIPVTERLPEIEEDVLIAATVHTKKGDVRAVTGDFINTAGQWNGASCSWRYEVTHWMPLPQPPKMEMPKNCWECHFGHGETGICVVDFKPHGDWNEPHNCPLVPVPPHGDLIDRAVLEKFKELVTTDVPGGKLTREYVPMAAVRNVKTIIPAEEDN